MSSPFSWPLAISPHTLLDRARIAWWVLSQDRFTMGARVAELEAKMAAFSGMHALMVANGSVANQLVFELWKLKRPGVTPVVICPAVTWISSITPAMMAGMEVVFCDVNREDLAFDYAHLERLLGQYANRQVIIWPTALIGFVPDMPRIHRLAAQHGAAEVYLDSCENTFSRTELIRSEGWTHAELVDGSILATADITTTSIYLSHHVSGVEGGFVFFKHQADYDLARMFRNHGMTRSLAPTHAYRQSIETANAGVDPQFLFAVPGTNLRPSDVHAMFGLADLKRAEVSREHRTQIYGLYSALLDRLRYYLPPAQRSHVAFCIPIFVRDPAKLAVVKAALVEAGIEGRPMVGSHLGYQPALKHLFDMPSAYPNAEWVHRHAMYVGLHKGVTPAMVRRLTNLLNSL